MFDYVNELLITLSVLLQPCYGSDKNEVITIHNVLDVW